MVEDGSFSSMSGKKITKFQTGDLFNSNGVNLISAALAEDSEGDAVVLELENTTEQLLYFEIGEISINNIAMTDITWDTVSVNPGGRGLLVINIKNLIEYSDKEKEDIGDISNIGFYAAIGSADGRYLVKDEKVGIDFTNENDNQKKSETKKKESTSAESSSKDSDLVDGMHPEFKEAMDSYEEFMDEYCEFMEKYKDSDGTDIGMLADYTEYLSKYTEFVDSFDDWDEDEMNDTELAYYLDVQNRVNKKLLEVD